jgi:hypothetical protein
MSSRLMDRDVTAAAGSGAAVTPDDGANLAQTSRAIYVGGAGNLAVILDRDTNPVIFLAVAAGTMLPIRARRVMSTNTTATSILALY